MVSATRAAKDPDWAFVPLGAIFLSLSEMWHMSKPVKKSVFFFSIFWVIPETCPNLVMAFVFKVLRNRMLRYRVETCPVSRPVMAFLFKVLRNRLLRYRLGTCPNLWWRLCSKCRAIDCFVQTWNMSSVQTCDGIPVQSATQPTASVQTWNMSKPVMTFVFKVLRKRLLRADLKHVQCPDLWWRSCSKCYATDCFGTDLEHVQTCDDVCVQSATQSTASCRLDNMSSVQTCDGVPVQSATQPTASVHTWNMSKPVMTFVFKVLRNRLLRYLTHVPNLWLHLWQFHTCLAFFWVLGGVCSATL